MVHPPRVLPGGDPAQEGVKVQKKGRRQEGEEKRKTEIWREEKE